MEGDRNDRLPLNHLDRIKARDSKLHQRDEQRANRNGLTRYRCPCNLCGGRRRPYKRTTVARHLRHRGRHGALRGWTQVIYSPLHTSEWHGWGGPTKWHGHTIFQVSKCFVMNFSLTCKGSNLFFHKFSKCPVMMCSFVKADTCFSMI